MSPSWVWLIPHQIIQLSKLWSFFTRDQLQFSENGLLKLPPHYSFHSSAATLLELRSGPLPWAAFGMNSCVLWCVCLCVRPINISTLPNSRCLYNRAVLFSSCLQLYLLDCFIEEDSDTLYEVEQKRANAYSQPASSRHLSLRLLLYHCDDNLGTNLCVVLAKIDELPGWESALLHSGGNDKSLSIQNRRAPWRGACVRCSFSLPCLHHLSWNLSPSLFTFPSLDPSPQPVLDNDKWCFAQLIGPIAHRKAHRISSGPKI